MLGRQTVVGGSWMVGGRLLSRLIDLGTMFALAHLLTPKDVGLVAIAMTVVYIIEAALELPVYQALVRLSSIESVHYDTAFTLSFLRAVGISAAVALIGWPFARFYQDRRLMPLVLVLSLAPAARGLASPRLADFSKQMNFAPDFIMEVSGKLSAFLVALTLGLSTRSYWAIAAGTAIAPIASTVTSYVLAPYRPRFTISAFSAFSGFLGWASAAQAVSALNWQTDRLLLGKLTSRAQLGLFTAANDTSIIPVMALLGPVNRPLLAAFSLVKDNVQRLRQSYQRSATAMVTIGLPILVAESLLAPPLVRLLFGQQWLGAVPLLRWLALSLIPTLFALPLGSLVMAFDRTRVLFHRNLFELCVKIPLVVLGALKFGFLGVILARCISESLTVLFCTTVVHRLIGLSPVRQLLASWRSLLSVLVMGVVLAAVAPAVTSAETMLPLAAGLLFSAFLGAATYCCSLWVLWTCSGRPAGIEAMVDSFLADLLQRRSRLAAEEPL